MVGNRVKKLREELDLKQEELAKKIGVSPSAIGMYERDLREANDDIKIKMAELFECSVDYLIGKSDIRNPGKQIDEVLNEAMIGMSKEEYEKLSETQKKQIRDFALFVKKQNEDKKENK